MAKNKIIICDTGIFFAYFKGIENVINELDNHIGFENLGISVITIGEIYYGMRKNEKLATKTLINQFNNVSY